MSDLLSPADFEREAERRLDPAAYAYFSGGAGDEWTLRENIDAFSRRHLRPRVLIDVSEVSTVATVLGEQVSMPVLLAPVGYQSLAHPDGEVAAAKAAAAAGTIYCLPTLSVVGPQECAAAAAAGRRWFQLYWSHDRGFTRELLDRAAGYSALVLTVDFPRSGGESASSGPGSRCPPTFPIRTSRRSCSRSTGAWAGWSTRS